jgi:hypothetical protein
MKNSNIPQEEDRPSFSFGWEVEKREIFYNSPILDSQYVKNNIPDRYALVRNDNDRCLSLVSSRYTPFYNNRFERIVNSYLELGSKNPIKKEFNGGARLSVQLKNEGIATESLTGQIMNNQGIQVDDTHKGYITMINGHDKRTPWLFGLTVIRIICKNTFTMALKGLRDGNALFQGKHLKSSEIDWEIMQDSVVSASNTMKDYMFEVDQLKNKTWDPKDNHKFFMSSFGLKRNKKSKYGKRLEGLIWNYDITYRKYAQQFGSDNRYTAFNAITHLVDHDASKKQQERGWAEVGRGQAVKHRAFELLKD